MRANRPTGQLLEKRATERHRFGADLRLPFTTVTNFTTGSSHQSLVFVPLSRLVSLYFYLFSTLLDL